MKLSNKIHEYNAALHGTPRPKKRGSWFWDAMLGALTLLFVALKLTGAIGWAWYLVLLPLWGPVALFLLGMLLYIIYKRL